MKELKGACQKLEGTEIPQLLMHEVCRGTISSEWNLTKVRILMTGVTISTGKRGRVSIVMNSSTKNPTSRLVMRPSSIILLKLSAFHGMLPVCVGSFKTKWISRAENSHRKQHGIQIGMVSSKHGVKVGLSVYHVEFQSCGKLATRNVVS